MPRKKKELLIGNGMNANLLKQFIDYSYLGNTSIAPEGYSIDAPLSDSRVKVYTKNGSNDKDVIITHRGSVGLDDWMDNASYLFRGKVKGTKTYNLHRERHKKAVEKYGAKNIIAIGHSRAGLYLQELQKEFPIKENITYNKASGFFDIGRKNDANQTDVRVGNDIVSLLAPLQKRPTEIVKIDGTKNPFDFNTAHQSSEIDKLGTTFIGKKEEAEGGAIKRKRGRPRKIGEGIQPRISGVDHIRKLLGVEQRRLQRMKDGTTEYSSPYMTETKTKEKINRLKKRLESAEANQGHASAEFFVPDTESWLKIQKKETYLNTPLKSDGKHKLMLSEIERRIAELERKKEEAKEAKRKAKAKAQDGWISDDEEEEEDEKDKAIPVIINVISDNINKAKIAFETKQKEVKEEIKQIEAPKPKQTKEEIKQQKLLIKAEKKKAKKEKKAEYDRLRYLEIKANKLGKQTKTTTTEKQVEKLEEKVETFKEEVKDYVEELDQEDIAKQLANMNDDETEEESEEEEEEEDVAIDVVKINHNSSYYYLTLDNGVLLDDNYKIVGYLHSDGHSYSTLGRNFDEWDIFNRSNPKDKGSKVLLRRSPRNMYSGTLLTFYFDKNTRQLDYYDGNTDDKNFSLDTIEVPRATYDEIKKKYNEREHIKQGKGFSKKQLTQIILDKNKVIADLEETAYGGNCCDTNYLNNILDSNTTSQNIIIHKEHFNRVPKYIKSLELEM